MLYLVGEAIGYTILDIDGRPLWAEKPGHGMHHLARQAVFPSWMKVLLMYHLNFPGQHSPELQLTGLVYSWYVRELRSQQY